MDDVVWLEAALQDLDDIAAYIALDNPSAAEITVRRIAESAAGLGYFPRIGRAGRIDDTRELVVVDTPYIVVYRIRDRIEILAIMHGMRSWPDALE